MCKAVGILQLLLTLVIAKLAIAFQFHATVPQRNVPQKKSLLLTGGLTRPRWSSRRCRRLTLVSSVSGDAPLSDAAPGSSSPPSPPRPPPPVLNGQRVLPTKVLLGGLEGCAPVAAVYAVLGASHRRGGSGWEAVQYVGITRDLADTIRVHAHEKGSERVAHVRALSFTYPQPTAMQSVAAQWRDQASGAGSNLDDQELWTRNALEYVTEGDDDDNEDDENEDWLLEMTAQALASAGREASASLAESSEGSSESSVVSPFAEDDTAPKPAAGSSSSSSSTGRLPLTVENIDRVLEEVRPYLIADGGNVAVARIDPDAKAVYLELQGACGSCPSSTVTMQMGIERVLKEHFDVEQVLQIDNGPKELTWEAVEKEVNRIRPAIVAMGGVCELTSVDASTGVVQVKFRGFNKVQQGLELALLDVPFVNAVQFVMGDD